MNLYEISPQESHQDGRNGKLLIEMGMSENVVYPIVPNGFADHYPY